MIKTLDEELEIIHKDVGIRVSGYYSMPEIQNRKIDELVAAHNESQKQIDNLNGALVNTAKRIGELEKRVEEIENLQNPFKSLVSHDINPEPAFKVGDKVMVTLTNRIGVVSGIRKWHNEIILVKVVYENEVGSWGEYRESSLEKVK